jgi:hypothetical protein
MKTFTAPWSGVLIGVSVLATGLCLGIAISGVFNMGGLRMPVVDFLFRVALPLALMFGCALFTVRGYAITPDAILVKRLFWDTRLPRKGLESAAFQPGVMKGSIRTFGNGGFYSFTGFYRNRELRNYRALVTSNAKTVVLRYADRTIVLSPGAPEAFVAELSRIDN